MRRRDLIVLLGGTAAAWPIASHSQQRKKIPRIGVLWHAANAEEEDVYLSVLTKAFNDLGYVDGKSVQLEHRFPDETPDRFRAIAREFVETKVDVIIAVTALGAKEAKQATNTIPVVFVVDPDPVGSGLVESLAHPGGNVTGLSLMAIDVSGKRLDFFKELVPNLSRVAIMVDPRDPTAPRFVAGYEKAARLLGLSTQLVEVTTPDQIERRFPQLPEMASMAWPSLDRCSSTSACGSAQQPSRTRYQHSRVSLKWFRTACFCPMGKISLISSAERSATPTKY